MPEGVIDNNVACWETSSSIVCMGVTEHDYGESLVILYASKDYLESIRTD